MGWATFSPEVQSLRCQEPPSHPVLSSSLCPVIFMISPEVVGVGQSSGVRGSL